MSKLKVITYWNPLTEKYNAEVPERPDVGVKEGVARNDASDAAEEALGAGSNG